MRLYGQCQKFYLNNIRFIILPINWTELTDLFVSELSLLSESEDRPVTQVKMCISGNFTSTAREALTAKGITLKENM